MTETPDSMTASKEGSAQGAGATRILVVEDEKHLAAGLKLNLELEGYSVDIAGDAKEAAALLLRSDSYGAIILDVMLPDLDGFELCESRGQLSDGDDWTPNLVPVLPVGHGRLCESLRPLDLVADFADRVLVPAAVKGTADVRDHLAQNDLAYRLELHAHHVDLALDARNLRVVDHERAAFDVPQVAADQVLTNVLIRHGLPSQST